MRLRFRALNRRKIGTSAPPIPPIYGLRFDGINDNLTLDQTYSWNGNSVIVDLVMRDVAATYNGIGCLQSNRNNTRLLYGEVGGDRRFFIGNSAQSSINIGENNDRTTITVTDLGGTSFRIESSVNASSYNVTASSVVRSFDTFGSEQARFFLHADVVSFSIGGVVFNDANNWNNATINGAVRIVSFDNGVTWQTV